MVQLPILNNCNDLKAVKQYVVPHLHENYKYNLIIESVECKIKIKNLFLCNEIRQLFFFIYFFSFNPFHKYFSKYLL